MSQGLDENIERSEVQLTTSIPNERGYELLVVAPRHSRGAWRYCLGHRVLSCTTCVVNFVFALSQLQGVEWGWPGRREPDDDEHLPGLVGEGG